MLKEIMPKFEADVREHTITTVMVFQLAMLCCDYGFGYERLKKFHRKFLHFAADMKENRAPTRMLVDLLKDECGYDFEKETELIDKELTVYVEVFRPLEGLCDEYIILAACMNLIQSCDAVLQCDGWQSSAGCRSEAAFAIVHDIPCIDADDLLDEK